MPAQPAMIRVEFFGIVRRRAGVADLAVPIPADADALTLGEILEMVADRLPQLASECVVGQRAASGYLTCINGRQFTSDPAMTLHVGDSVQLLSADVGG
jgi:molybdopterin converting factor small subunit